MTTAAVIQVILQLVIGTLLNALIIWVVGRLRLGITVRSFGSAVVAALVIALLGALVGGLLVALGLSWGAGLIGSLISLVVAAVVLLLAGKMLRGLEVSGFSGAIIAAAAIGLIQFVIGWVLSAFVR